MGIKQRKKNNNQKTKNQKKIIFNSTHIRISILEQFLKV